MNKIIISSIILLFISCGNDKPQVEELQTDKLQYAFTKEGELHFITNETTNKIIDLEFAESPDEQGTGLMYRDAMAENQGMIFINDAPREQNFYMKNTRIPLDLIYVSPDSIVVDIQRNAKPMDETIIPSDTVSQYVVELNAGMADKWKLEEGKTKVSWKKN